MASFVVAAVSSLRTVSAFVAAHVVHAIATTAIAIPVACAAMSDRVGLSGLRLNV